MRRTISDIQEVFPLKAYVPRTGSSVPKGWLDKTFPPVLKSDTFVGIEIEVEGHRQNLADGAATEEGMTLRSLIPHLWETKEDGSLRNGGIEYVSYKGTNVTLATQALSLLERYFELFYTRLRAGGRCGVHIHVNCLDKTMEEVAAFCALYTVVEKSLFNFTGNRINNNFCVPVRQSTNFIGSIIRSALKNNEQDFQVGCISTPKYLAFNVGAMRRFGTIELRHMAGTTHPKEIIPWLHTITSMFSYATSMSCQQLLDKLTNLNTSSEYEQVAREVFPREFIEKVGLEYIRADMEFGCSLLKEYLIDPRAVRDTSDEVVPPEEPNVLRGAVRRPDPFFEAEANDPLQNGRRAHNQFVVEAGAINRIADNWEQIVRQRARAGLEPIRINVPRAIPEEEDFGRVPQPPRELFPVLEGSRWEPDVTGESAENWRVRRARETRAGIRQRNTRNAVGREVRHPSQAPSWGRSSRVVAPAPVNPPLEGEF